MVIVELRISTKKRERWWQSCHYTRQSIPFAVSPNQVTQYSTARPFELLNAKLLSYRPFPSLMPRYSPPRWPVMFAIGLQVAAATRVGHELGSGNPIAAKRAAFTAAALAAIESCALALVLLSLQR